MLCVQSLTWIAALLLPSATQGNRFGYDFETLPAPPNSESSASSIAGGYIGGSVGLQACLWIGGQLQLINGNGVEAVTHNGIAAINNDSSNYRYEHPTGNYTLLPSLLGGSKGFVNDVNPFGFAVGLSPSIPGGVSDAGVVWDRKAVPHDIGSLGSPKVGAFAINELGWIVGYSGTAGLGRRAFVWKEGSMHALESLPGLDTGESYAYDINDHGMVVGEIRGPGKGQGVLWPSVVSLPRALGPRIEEARDINNRGQVLANNYEESLLWVEGSTFALTDLAETPSNWKLQGGGIDDDGRIAGTGIDLAGNKHAYLMTPKKGNLNLDAVLDRADATRFAAAYIAGESPADMNGDGAIETCDLTEFLAAFREAR
jgi:probable HAF family extracellular repeat protein